MKKSNVYVTMNKYRNYTELRNFSLIMYICNFFNSII